jgi:hypothetical protein
MKATDTKGGEFGELRCPEVVVVFSLLNAPPAVLNANADDYEEARVASE